MAQLDLQKLDRDIRAAAKAERTWRRDLRANVELAAGRAWHEPVRYATTRTTFASVMDLPEGDVLRAPLLRWIHRLALSRIGERALVHAEAERQLPKLELEKPLQGTHSARDVVRRVLADREAVRAGGFLVALEARGPAVLAAERTSSEALTEISSRLGVTDPSLVAAYPRDALAAEAERFLSVTADLADSLFRPHEDLAHLLGELVARDVPGIWPSRAHARWLFEQFQSTPLLEGLVLDLGPTPPPLGAASFARSLARFGAAYARAAAPARAPFVLTHDADDAHPLRRGALFASLVADASFLQKKLAFSREEAKKVGRALAKTLLADARLAATRTLVDLAMATPSGIRELVEDAVRVRVAEGLGCVLPRARSRAPERLLASFLAHADREDLCSVHDEDWFLNPRALFALRDRDAAPRLVPLAKEAIEGAALRLARTLEILAG